MTIVAVVVVVVVEMKDAVVGESRRYEDVWMYWMNVG
jgi:hypothetical protein